MSQVVIASDACCMKVQVGNNQDTLYSHNVKQHHQCQLEITNETHFLNGINQAEDTNQRHFLNVLSGINQ